MKKFTKILTVLITLTIGLVYTSCSNTNDSNDKDIGNPNEVLSTWIGSEEGEGIVFTVYSGNTAKVTAPEGNWEAYFSGDVNAESGTITITVTKTSDNTRVKAGDIFIGTKTSKNTMILTADGRKYGTYTKQ